MSITTMHDGRVVLHQADCRDVLRGLPDNSIDSVVTDPPYALVSIQKRFGKPGSAPAKVREGASGAYARASSGFMGKSWDTGEVAFSEEFWAEVWRVLKPGGHVVAFSGTRTYHRMAVAIEDAGFEIRDQLGWVYGSGFPKSHDVQKAIQKTKGRPGEDAEGNPIWCESCGEAHAAHNAQGHALLCSECAAADWEGWGSALKPAWEPICLARKPLIGTIAENVLVHAVGGLNIQGCRVGDEVLPEMKAGQAKLGTFERHDMVTPERVGRWPANIIHDGSDEVLAAFPDTKSGMMKAGTVRAAQDVPGSVVYGVYGGDAAKADTYGDSGSAARFFYCAKASRADRDAGLSGGEGRKNTHPTVKPTSLCQWLCRLVTPPGGKILDPFMGSGSTGKAAVLEGFQFIGCEREDEYMPIATARIAWAIGAADKDEPADERPAVAPQQPAANDNDLFSVRKAA